MSIYKFDIYRVFRNLWELILKIMRKKKSYKCVSCLSSFIRCNEFSVLITFTKDARSDHLAFEDEPARVLSFIWLLSLYRSWCFPNLSEALLYSIS